MRNGIGRGLGTVAVWGGIALLSILFHSFGILSGDGATWMVVGAFIVTVVIWEKK